MKRSRRGSASISQIGEAGSLDRWAQWLLRRRHGGDADTLRKALEWLHPVRDRVLANAVVAEGDVVLDVLCGDGLIAFGALEKLGPAGRVIFSDVSEDLLDHCRVLAGRMGVLERCDFVRAPAEALSPVRSASVDVVTTRSVLIYVEAKEAAFREFRRVLRAGGRLSIFEPINRFNVSLRGGTASGAIGTTIADARLVAARRPGRYDGALARVAESGQTRRP